MHITIHKSRNYKATLRILSQKNTANPTAKESNNGT